MNNSILTSDLIYKFDRINSEKSTIQFYLLIADYGRTIHKSKNNISHILDSLEEARKENFSRYDAVYREFISEWKKLTKDLLNKAKKDDIHDSPNDFYCNITQHLLDQLRITDPMMYWDTISDLFNPYRELVEKFIAKGLKKVLIPQHINSDGVYNLLHLKNKVDNEWTKFKQTREITTWWSHYNIMRLTSGVYEDDDFDNYFKEDNYIDELYRFEFSQLAKGENDGIMLHRYKFNNYINCLHHYLLPRLNDLEKKSDAYSIKNLPKNWKWYDKKENIFQFGSRTYKQTGDKLRSIVFRELMDYVIGLREAISVQDLSTKTNTSHERVRIEINAISKNLKPYNLQFKGSRKGYYIPLLSSNN